MNSTKKEEGLPDIAEVIRQKKSWVVIGILAVLSAMAAVYFHFVRTEQPKQQSVEETYTVTSQPPIEIKKPEQDDTAKPEATTELPIKPPSEEVIQQQIALIQEKQKELQQRLAAPLMLVNTNQASNSSAAVQSSQAASSDTNTQFMNQISAQNTEVSVATPIGQLNSVIAEGSLIHAILESASHSDLPGYLRASVSEPVYSEDGSQILIPRGSRLNGQYKSGMLQGQSRIFVVWSRLITPSGISLQLGSSGVDGLGVAGMGADEINRHFWQRFGRSSMLSLLGAGAANIGVSSQDQNNSAANYREAVASSFAQSANQSLQQDSQIAPTLKTYQGKPIMVFVARDLNFQSVIKQTKNKLNVF